MASAYYYRWAAQRTYHEVHTNKKSYLIDKTRLSTDWVRPTSGLETGQRGEDDELIQCARRCLPGPFCWPASHQRCC